MTEQQINRLKDILTKSDHELNPVELDQKILDAATKEAERRSQTTSVGQRRSFANRYLQASAIAVVVTLTTFVGMGYWLEPKSEYNVALSTDDIIPIDVPSHTTDSKDLHRPDRIEVAQPPARSRDALDQILLESELPNSVELMAMIDLGHEAEQAVRLDVSLALADINSMLRVGELDNARERYALLRQDCSECRLPDSLEALVVLHDKQSRRESG